MLKKILFVAFACISIVGVTSGANALTVSYDCGTSTGAAPTDSANYNSGDVVTVKPNSCDVPSGKHFAGYICGSTNVAAGNTFTISSNTTCVAQYENGKFAVKTINLNAGDVFKFGLNVTGTFTVDCGDGGTLSSSANPTDVSGDTITRTITTTTTYYTCTWDNAGAHTITFDGTGTGYNTSNYTTLTFYVGNNDTDRANNSQKIASVSGNLYLLLPPTGTANGQIPRFSQTFYKATNLTSIPHDLFNGYTTGANNMFSSTFSGCTGLTSIPSDLFSSFTTGADYMFQYTFSGCTGLTSLPDGMFASLTTGAREMFSGTFSGCTGLTSLPSGLFENMTTGAHALFRTTFSNCTGLTTLPAGLFGGFTTGATAMFVNTFMNCTGLKSLPSGLFASLTTGAMSLFEGTFLSCEGLTSIPSDLFSNLNSNAEDMMFSYTFGYCSDLTSIPANLFSNFTTGEYGAFYGTFEGCTSLTTLPNGLFANMTSGAEDMFYSAFAGCTNLSGYIPPSLFAGLIKNNATYETGMMTDIFSNTGLATSCPSGTARYETPYDSYWDSHVSCANIITINWNGATAAAIAANNAGTAVYGGDIRTPASYDPSLVPVGKRFVGWKFRKPFNLSTYLSEPYNNANSAGSGYISNDGSNSYNTSTYDLTVDGTWGVTLANNFGSVRGESRCSDTDNGNSNTHIGNPGNATTGKYCWCKATNYRAYNDTLWQNVLVVPWVFYGDYGSPTNCATGCGEACAYGGRQNPNFRTLLLNLQ